MKFNPFRQDPAKEMHKMEIKAQQNQAREDIAGRSTGVDEAWALDSQKEKAELTRWQQDLTEEVETLIHELRNERVNEEGEWVRNKIMGPGGGLVDAEPLCSDDGIWRIIAMLQPSTSKNLMMSKYDKESILSALLDLTNAVTLHLIANRKKYKIRMSDLSPIMQMFKTAATPTYFRALGANEKEYLKGIRKDTYLHTKEDDEKRRLF